MKPNYRLYGFAILSTAVVFASGCGRRVEEPGLTLPVTQSQAIVSPEQQKRDAAGFHEFMDRVSEYVKLHNSLESGLPPSKSTALPEMITAHQLALARKIREARPNAKEGDVFTAAAQEAFRHAVQNAMRGPQGPAALSTMKEGAPLTKTDLAINQAYPDNVPFTTVPPTLLQALPRLPDPVVYRVVARDLVLLDLRANLVVDLIPGIIP